MKKKIIVSFLFVISLLIQVQNINKFSRAALTERPELEEYYLNTDKEEYFTDEIIYLTASWNLSYNLSTETASVKIQIYDENNINIWNLSECNKTGFIEKNWNLNIENLNSTFEESKKEFDIRLIFSSAKFREIEEEQIKKNKIISILKRDLSNSNQQKVETPEMLTASFIASMMFPIFLIGVYIVIKKRKIDNLEDIKISF